MNKKVAAVFRGSIGDACIWLIKLRGLFQRHTDDQITFVINSRYNKVSTMYLLCLNKDMEVFYNYHPERILDIPYHMPTDLKKVLKLTGKWDILYQFDVWNENKWNPPAAQMYPELGNDFYPAEIPKECTNKIVLHPYGYNIKDTWTKEKWYELKKKFASKGYEVVFMGSFEKNSMLQSFAEIIQVVKYSRLWIGVDTGTRNLAMIFKVPAIELGTPGKGDPNFDVFHPKEYRWNSFYFPNIDTVSVDALFNKGMEFLK